MGIEIERRWLLDDDSWASESDSEFEISQYYLDMSELRVSRDGVYWGKNCLCEDDLTAITWVTARFRIVHDKCLFTLKSASKGASRDEFETEIVEPIGVRDLPGLDKTRHHIRGVDNLLWEVDVFKGGLEGIVIAEVELPREDYPVVLPSWLGKELTNLKGWSNADLVKRLSSQEQN